MLMILVVVVTVSLQLFHLTSSVRYLDLSDLSIATSKPQDAKISVDHCIETIAPRELTDIRLTPLHSFPLRSTRSLFRSPAVSVVHRE